MGSLLLGLLAGTLTTLSPCVLPILPIVLLGAFEESRLGPLALAGGVITTFVALGVALAGAGWALDISSEAVKAGAAALMVMFGLVLLSSALQQRIVATSGPLTAPLNRMLERFTPQGLWGQYGLGALLGAVWTPCSGPTLGAAVTLAANSQTAAKAAAIMLFFALGACIPLMAIAYGSRQSLIARRDLMRRFGSATKPILGGVILLLGVLVLLGVDKMIETAFVNSMPDWLVRVTTQF